MVVSYEHSRLYHLRPAARPECFHQTLKRYFATAPPRIFRRALGASSTASSLRDRRRTTCMPLGLSPGMMLPFCASSSSPVPYHTDQRRIEPSHDGPRERSSTSSSRHASASCATRALPGASRPNRQDRVRETLRYGSRLRHIGPGRAHVGTKVEAPRGRPLCQRVVSEDGELSGIS